MKKSLIEKQVITAYKSGMRIREMCAQFKLSYDTIERILFTDTQYAKDAAGRYGYDINTFARLYRAEYPVHQIMEIMGVNRRAINRIRHIAVSLGKVKWRLQRAFVSDAAKTQIDNLMDKPRADAPMSAVINEMKWKSYKPAIRYIKREYGTTLNEWRHEYRQSVASFCEITGVAMSSACYWYHKKLFTLPFTNDDIISLLARGMAMRRDIRLDTGFRDTIIATRARLMPVWISRTHVRDVVRRYHTIRYITEGVPHLEFPRSWDNIAYDRATMVTRIRQIMGTSAAHAASDDAADWEWLR